VARECVALVRPIADAQLVQIQADLVAIKCSADGDQLAQVITNLLTNAIYYNLPNGKVDLTLRSENGTALLRVSDTGQGIPADDLPHIFERFYRVDKSRSRATGRSGLGLAICKAIVDGHKGSIDVASVPSGGSTFTVKLPIG
jgi:two-component system, OmpR family, sensor kinase